MSRTLVILASTRILGVMTLASAVATEVFAWQRGWHPGLGTPLLTWGRLPLYGPWAIWEWASAWAWGAPEAFRLAGSTFVIVAGLGLWPQERPQAEGHDPGARWASRQTLADEGLFASEGVSLGRWRRRRLLHNREGHVLFVAPTGSSKTQTMGIPTCATWRGSLFAHDPKGELHDASGAYRGTFAKVIYLNPTSAASHRYDPTSAIRIGQVQEIRDALLVVELLTDPDGQPAHGGAAQHFRELTNDFVLGVVMHGLYTRQATNLVEFDRFFMHEADLELVIKDMLATTHFPQGVPSSFYGAMDVWAQAGVKVEGGIHPAVQRGMTMLRRMADRELSGVCTTASRALRMTLDPLTARMLTGNDFVLSDLRERVHPMALYLTIPYSHQESLRPLSRLIVRQVLDWSTGHLGGWRHRLCMLIDEVQALHCMPALSQALNYARGYGVTLVCITPSLNALDEQYGVHNNFLEESHLRVVYAPNDPKVAARFAEMTPKVEVEHQRTSTTWHGWQKQTTVSTSLEEERLFSADQVSAMRKEGLLLIGHGGKPAIIHKSPAFLDRKIRKVLGLKRRKPHVA